MFTLLIAARRRPTWLLRNRKQARHEYRKRNLAREPKPTKLKWIFETTIRLCIAGEMVVVSLKRSLMRSRIEITNEAEEKQQDQ